MSKNNSKIIPAYQIALVQMRPDFLNREANLEKAEAALREAAANGAKLVCFPESFDLGYGNTSVQEMVSFTLSVTNTTLQRICMLAKELHIHILTPIFWKTTDGNVENTAFLIDDQGTILGSYAKTHLTDNEKLHLTRGKDYPVFDTKLGKIGIAICYDICFPEVARILALSGAQMLLVPAAWRGGKHYAQWWNIDLSSCALDNLVYTVGINMIGPANSEEFFAGMSQVCAPTGEKLCICGEEETILYSQIDLSRIATERQKNSVLLDRHPLDYRMICDQ